MSANIFLDLCAIIIVLMLIITLRFRKQTNGRSNMLFWALCFCVLISGLTDMVSYYYDTAPNVGPESLAIRFTVNYIYFYVRNFTAPLYILYVCSQTGIWHKITGGSLLQVVWGIPYLVDVLLLLSNHWTHLVFYYDESYIYHRGLLMPVLYGVAFFYMFFCIGILIAYFHMMERGKSLILFLFLPVNAAAVILQFFFPLLCIEIVSSAMMLIIVVITIQRPEEMVDSIVGTMSNTAFIQDMKQAFRSIRPMSVLLIHFKNHSALRNNLGLFTYQFLLRRLADKTAQIGKIMNLHPDIYYLDNGSFAVVSDDRHAESMLDLGRVIHAYMQEPVRLKHTETLVNTVVCLVKCPDDIYDYETFISFSRTFHSKLPQNNRVSVLSEIISSRDFVLKSQMDHIINRGIANHKFQMFYQPIYSLKQKRFVSAEALIRLYDDEYGSIPPSIFIPAAEESGAIHKIGDFVIEDVCRFIASEPFQAMGLEYIELNLSLSQCIEQDLPDKIRYYMDQYQVRPDQINLEITETASDYDPTTTDRNIAALAAQGIHFSLDDYGTGYSNIKRVVSLPLHIVKLDKSLVDAMDSQQMWAVIHNTVRMLQRINKKVLVEGVETERALHAFEEIGCDYIQGYYFSKPLSEGEFIYFIQNNANHNKL